ncbi:MAG: 50S ribosomal protein L9 [Mucinivorans sp.]
MEIILKQDIDTLGYKDQIVNVKPGYANNFLIPQGFAVSATVSAKKVHAENIRQRAHKEEKMVADATAIAAKLEAMAITLSVKANESGRIFGSITATDLADAIKAKGVELDKKTIKVPAIKEIGAYTASVRIYKEIGAQINVEVVASAPAAE